LSTEKQVRYRDAGVNIDEADRAVSSIRKLARQTFTRGVLTDIGAFGASYQLSGFHKPVLVSSADGVGTKLKIAFLAGRHDTVGEDLVNHCVNDILVHGARPVGFLDYYATGHLDPVVAADVVAGVARGCRAHGMPLVGGETAEMPDVYREGEYDLAGTIVGVVAEEEAIHGDRVAAGDLLVGYAANGFHTNGYSLLRRVVFGEMGLGPLDRFPETDRSVADVLLAVHRSYLASVWPARARVHALAHITGGGIPGNLARVLPPAVDAVVRDGAWPVPPACLAVQHAGRVSQREMRHVFNLGVGLIAVCAAADAEAVRWAATEAGVQTWVVGEVVQGQGAVRWVESGG
jgi:phosphoribosylformylglycinamidine cyclo-ligase